MLKELRPVIQFEFPSGIVLMKRTIDITIDQQVALDEALVPHASRLRIGKSHFRLRSDLKSKESTLQVVYDAIATIHHHSICFKMNNKKHIVNLEYFREMLQICPRIPNQQFDELPFKEEILTFLRELGHSGEIKMITDGMYHKKKVDFAYLLWEDFVYQVEHKDAKKSNEMYYPRFTKIIVNFFMTNDQSILRRNKVNWHFARDDHMFKTIKLVSRHQNTQQYGAIFPIELTNESIKNSESYKEYNAIASGAEPRKTKASIRKKQEKQPAKTSTTKVADEGTGIISGVSDVPTYESDDKEISWKLTEEDDDEVNMSEHDEDVDDQNFVHLKFSTHDNEARQEEELNEEESFDPIVQTPSHVENIDDEDNDEDSYGMNVEGDEGSNEEDDGNELYGDMNINLEGQQQSSSVSSRFVSNMLNPSPDTSIDSIFESTLRVDIPVTTTTETPLLFAKTLLPPSTPIIPYLQQTPAPSPTKQFAEAISSIPDIVDKYIDNRMNKDVKVAVQLQSDMLRDEAQAKNENLLNKLDEKLQKIITEQVKEQVKTSYVLAADLFELELKKILIDNMESNKSIHRSDEQKNLYKALVDAYECDKLILDTYEDTVTLKRCRDDEDKDEEPPLDQTGGPREDELEKNRTASESAPAEEPMHTTKYLEEHAHQEFDTGAPDDQPVEEASQHPDWFQTQPKPPTPDRAWNKTLSDTHGCIQPWIKFVMNRLKVDTLTPKLLAGPTYELMKGSCKSLVELEFFLEEGRRVIPFDHFINNDLEYLRGSVSSRKYTTSVTKTKAADYGHIKWIKDLVPRTMWGQVPIISVESYQKKINLIKPDTYRLDLKQKEAYTSYSNPRGLIYQNKDKQNRLMRIDELHKFINDTLNDVRTTLDDRLREFRYGICHRLSGDEVIKIEQYQ
uniref:Uncharacterized protein n=1 Tax=Tanacetum cinerariifolium TaxID=118510 RepID=A0A6L2K826_TANCI|nr:hypothetical protein [Tanacetum cinerariifolium]